MRAFTAVLLNVWGVSGTVGLVNALAQWFMAPYTCKASWDQTGGLEYLWRNQEREVAGAAINLLAGFVLLLGRRGIAASWARLHPMGNETT